MCSAGFVLVLLLVMVDLDITGRLLIGMGKKLKPAELCFHTLARKRANELMWSMVAKPGGVLLSSWFVFIGMMAYYSCNYL